MSKPNVYDLLMLDLIKSQLNKKESDTDLKRGLGGVYEK